EPAFIGQQRQHLRSISDHLGSLRWIELFVADRRGHFDLAALPVEKRNDGRFTPRAEISADAEIEGPALKLWEAISERDALGKGHEQLLVIDKCRGKDRCGSFILTPQMLREQGDLKRLTI